MAKTIDPFILDKERATAGIGLVAHIFFFLLINSLLCYICMTSTGSVQYWIVFPVIGWGMGLYLHARSTYFFSYYKEPAQEL